MSLLKNVQFFKNNYVFTYDKHWSNNTQETVHVCPCFFLFSATTKKVSFRVFAELVAWSNKLHHKEIVLTDTLFFLQTQKYTP